MKERETITSNRYTPLMNRRSFISASLAFAAIGSIPLITNKGVAVNSAQNTNQVIEKLLSTLRDRQSAIQVGKVVLNEPHAALSLSHLVTSILNSLDLSFNALISIERVDLMKRLNHRTVLDFDSGAVFNAAGWILGQTEAKLCALAAKTQSLSIPIIRSAV